MFNNIGKKVKTLATVVCWIGIIGFIIDGIALIVKGNTLFGILIAAIGVLGSWIGSLGLYAIGEAADNSQLAVNISKKTNSELDSLQSKVLAIVQAQKNDKQEKSIQAQSNIVRQDVTEYKENSHSQSPEKNKNESGMPKPGIGYTVIDKSRIKCNKCGEIQFKMRIGGNCFSCGQEFKELPNNDD